MGILCSERVRDKCSRCDENICFEHEIFCEKNILLPLLLRLRRQKSSADKHSGFDKFILSVSGKGRLTSNTRFDTV